MTISNHNKPIPAIPVAPEGFEREERYLVIKRADLERLRGGQTEALRVQISKVSRLLPSREFLVIESDWPEYEPAWRMIEARMNGAAPEAPAPADAQPVALPSRDESLGTAESDMYANGWRHGWNAYQDAMVKLGPLYTHPDAGEASAAILTLQGQGYTYHGGQLWKPPIGKKTDFNLVDTLRTRLAERDALLDEIIGDVHFVIASDTRQRIEAALSATQEGKGHE